MANSLNRREQLSLQRNGGHADAPGVTVARFHSRPRGHLRCPLMRWCSPRTAVVVRTQRPQQVPRCEDARKYSSHVEGTTRTCCLDPRRHNVHALLLGRFPKGILVASFSLDTAGLNNMPPNFAGLGASLPNTHSKACRMHSWHTQGHRARTHGIQVPGCTVRVVETIPPRGPHPPLLSSHFLPPPGRFHRIHAHIKPNHHLLHPPLHLFCTNLPASRTQKAANVRRRAQTGGVGGAVQWTIVASF